MGIKRIVDVQFWNDDKVLEYFSPEDKLFMLYLMTNPHTTQLGIYPINKKHMSFELGYTIDVINVLLDRFENKYEMIKYSNETKEIAIKNYLKHSIIKGGKPVEDCLMKEIKQVKDKSLLGYVYSNIKECETLNDTVKKVIESLNEYDNDNDNEDTFTYRERIVKTEQSKKVKKSYGKYKRVKLTDKEYEKLCEDFDKSFIDNQITLLDEYVESNNNKNKYSNFNLVLRKSIKDNWFKKNTPTRKEIIPKWLDKEIEENTATDEEIAELERYMKRDSKSLEDRVAALQERIGQK
jgi:hypothetical protein